MVEIEGYLAFAQGGFYTFFLSGGDEVGFWSTVSSVLDLGMLCASCVAGHTAPRPHVLALSCA